MKTCFLYLCLGVVLSISLLPAALALVKLLVVGSLVIVAYLIINCIRHIDRTAKNRSQSSALPSQSE